MATERRLNRSGADGDILSFVAGSGILFIQACAVIPGLFPILLLLLPFVLPLVVLGAAVGLLVAVPLGIWRVVALGVRRWNGRARRAEEPASPQRLGEPVATAG